MNQLFPRHTPRCQVYDLTPVQGYAVRVRSQSVSELVRRLKEALESGIKKAEFAEDGVVFRVVLKPVNPAPMYWLKRLGIPDVGRDTPFEEVEVKTPPVVPVQKVPRWHFYASPPQ